MTTSDKVLAAIIAGLVSIFVSLITAYLSSRSARKKFQMEVSEKYSERLVELRLEHYAKAFEITGRIIFNAKNRNSSEELHQIRIDIRNWWVGPAAILLSKESVYSYYEMEKVLKRITSGEKFKEDNARELFEANRKFRKMLRKDLAIFNSSGFE